MAPRKFRWSVDGGGNWNYDEQELPFNLATVTALDTVVVEPIGDEVVNEGVEGLVRSVPSTEDRFYLVTRGEDGLIRSIRFERNLGAEADSANVGVKWLEWRPTGEAQLASFGSDPSSPLVNFTTDTGAQDIVGASAGGKYFGSYHGLGTGGSLNSETLLLDGTTLDPEVERIGDSFELTNDTTATDGTSTFTRSLTITVNAQGGLHFKVNSISTTAIALIYLGMGIGSGSTYTEADVKVGTDWQSIPLGDVNCRGYLAEVGQIRTRDPVNGRHVTVTGALKALSGYSRSEILKTTGSRTKIYLALFSSASALVDAEWDIDWGQIATGSVSPGTNLLSNTDWTTGWVNGGGGGGSAAGGVLTQTAVDGTTDLRKHLPITGCVSGDHYIQIVDAATSSTLGSFTQFVAGSNSNGSKLTPAPAFSAGAVLGRNIRLYVATQNDPEQRFMVALGSGATAGDVVQWSNPAVYAVAD